MLYYMKWLTYEFWTRTGGWEFDHSHGAGTSSSSHRQQVEEQAPKSVGWMLCFLLMTFVPAQKLCVNIYINTHIQWNPSRATPSRAATPLVRPYFQAPLYFSYISFKCQPLMNSHPTYLVRGQWFWFQPPLTSSHSAAARSGQPWNSWLIWLWAHRHTC